jgi:hypothetical protein
MDAKQASEIASEIQRASALCESSMHAVKTNENLGFIKVYGRLVGDFMGHSYTNVLAPIWKAFPELEPDEMKGPYVEPEPILTPESQQAIRAFVDAARQAVELTKRVVPSDQRANTFKYGGLEEVEEGLAKIEEFLARPRFRDENPIK